MRPFLRIPSFVAVHVALSVAAASVFAWQFGQNVRAVAAHGALVAEWDLALIGILAAVPSWPGDIGWIPRLGSRMLFGLTAAVQLYLYALNAASNLSWNRNMTGHLVVAFAPTVWSGKEPFPIGPRGIVFFTAATIALATVVALWGGRSIDRGVERWSRVGRSRAGSIALAAAVLFGATMTDGVAGRDSLVWKQELVTSFFRPEGFAFEPSERREAMAARDGAIASSYPREVSGRKPKKNVVLIIVDSLRADRMQVYGYGRRTTPFLSELVGTGQMKKVEDAFSTCSESFCGITSTLAGREFRDLSVRTFELQDALRDAGYQTWFLLSGNHRAWNGLPQFYRAAAGTFFDGTDSSRYSVDDDRVTLEALDRVPAASSGQPAFFYVHLMSTHYLGVQFAGSHVFTRPDDVVNPGLEPYKILERLNKPDRYDDKVRQADGVIRQLFDRFRAKGYLDDAVVVVTGDHGEGLGERHWAHGWHLYNEDVRIPLLLYDSPSVSYPDLTFAAQVDIAPTILDRLGLPIPESWEGQSLVGPSARRFTFHQTYFIPNRFAVVYRDRDRLFKFIATPQYGKEELYDLRSDPGESHNLVEQDPALAALLREKVHRYLNDTPAADLEHRIESPEPTN